MHDSSERVLADYFLPRHVHACFAANRTIFLDMKRGTYFGLDPERTQLLRHALDGPCAAEASTPPIAAELIGMGLLTTSRSAAKTFLPPATSAPEASLLPFIDDPPKINAARVARFVATCSAVAFRLKFRPLEQSLAHLAQRKSRSTAHFIADGAALDEARDLTRTFLHLRPLAYAARDRCLLDSLTLAEFLAGYGIRASCTFGVRANPFEAHCWVQIGSHVVNETPEMARRYAPILCV
jgi:hypothetical protein